MTASKSLINQILDNLIAMTIRSVVLLRVVSYT